MPVESLTSQQLGDMALNNATALISDAEVLLAADRHPRPFALAILAVEEIDKHVLGIGAAAFDPDDVSAWEKFWRRFRDHRAKFM
jgi:AbiV family abortive infection protein